MLCLTSPDEGGFRSEAGVMQNQAALSNCVSEWRLRRLQRLVETAARLRPQDMHGE